MESAGNSPSRHGLAEHGITACRTAYWNLTPAQLVEMALARGEGRLAANGSLVVSTGKYTGRSPNDKFVVEEPSSRDKIAWGKVNTPIAETCFDRLHAKIIRHVADRDLFVCDCFAGADEKHRLSVRIVSEFAWHAMFASNMFIRPAPGSTADHRPGFTVISIPSCLADPATDGTHSEAFILVHFARRLVIIGGTEYAGEIKKSIFTVMNYLLSEDGVLSMHCSANLGADGDPALFFGLSGTGKTTLSADPNRGLIGDDEHGWGDDGIFNIEAGCYAKCINLSRESEPDIYRAIRFGALTENVVMDPQTRMLDYDDGSRTQNTRVSYPLEHIDNAVIPSVGGHPRNVVLLTCDAFGVLPPVVRLTPEQAMYHFLSGYTAKVAGTERGVTEPQATFSACFGEPFLPLPPAVYAQMLGEKIARHKVDVWGVNTGWSGGPYGVGKRMKISYTRAMVTAALDGTLARTGFDPDPVFGVGVPRSCPGVPADVLTPRKTWANGAAYDAKSRELARLFIENFKRFRDVPADVAAAAPKA